MKYVPQLSYKGRKVNIVQSISSQGLSTWSPARHKNRNQPVSVIAILLLFAVSVLLPSNKALNAQFDRLNFGSSIQAVDSLFGGQQPVSVAPVASPQDVITADLDGDGDEDIITASSNDDKISWFENSGGDFENQHIVTVQADGIVAIFATDLDGDGDVDIISGSELDNKVAWYTNNGNGTFGEQQIISTNAEEVRSVFAADIDGDNLPDVISGSYGDQKIAWYKNNGDGTFAEEQKVNSDYNQIRTIYAADLDGDGDNDIVAGSNISNTMADKLVWYKNDGTGNFESANTISSEVYWPSEVQVADLNGDSHLDVLLASRDNNNVTWYANNGDGSFGDQQVIGTDVSFAYTVYPADLDGDGDMDIVSASSKNGNVIWYENMSEGIFNDKKLIDGDAVGARSVYAADVDGDNNLDIISANSSSNTISLYSNNGGSFDSGRNIVDSPIAGPKDIVSADFDDDGDNDVASASISDDKISWFENDGEGNFIAQHVVTTNANGAWSVRAADLTGDGVPEIIATSIIDDKIAWYENYGDGTFSSEQVLSTQYDRPKALAVADMDGDGDKDILFGAEDDYIVAWFENSAGEFEEMHTLDDGIRKPKSVFVIDLDDDMDLDVVVGYDHKVGIFTNRGDGSFASLKEVGRGLSGIQTVAAADVDGDDDIDILTTSPYTGVSWFSRNKYPGSYSDEINIMDESHFEEDDDNYTPEWKITVADVDSDSDTDVLLSTDHYLKESAMWFRNNGEGTFDLKVLENDPNGNEGINVADLDGDGNLDVITSSASGDIITWRENLMTDLVDRIDLTDDRATVSEDDSLLISILDNDDMPFPDYSVLLSDSTRYGVSRLENDTLFYKPFANFSGKDTAAYDIRINGVTVTGRVYIDVSSVNDKPQAKAAIASEQLTAEGYRVEFSDNSTDSLDPEGSITRITWEFGDGNSSDEFNPVHVYTEFGTYTVKHTIWDDGNVSDTTSLKIEVTGTELDGIALVDDQATVQEDDNVLISILDNDELPFPDYSVLIVDSTRNGELRLEKDTLFYQPSPNFFGKDSAAYVVQMNDDIDTSWVYIDVSSVNDMPQANAAIVSEELTAEGYRVEFSDNSTDSLDPEGSITRCVWDFGDGNSSDEFNPVHIYTEDGSYTVKQKIWDNDEASDSTTLTVEVVVTGLENSDIPDDFALNPNYPNPFNPSTMLSYDLPKASNVTLSVYNSLGQLVATLINEKVQAGKHSLYFDASHLQSGIYYYRITADKFTSTRKMMLIK